jgi:hypothetical protein
VKWTDLKGGAEYLEKHGMSFGARADAWHAYPNDDADAEFLGMPLVRSFIADWTAGGITRTQIQQDRLGTSSTRTLCMGSTWRRRCHGTRGLTSPRRRRSARAWLLPRYQARRSAGSPSGHDSIRWIQFLEFLDLLALLTEFSLPVVIHEYFVEM